MLPIFRLINGNMVSGELSPKLHELAVISEVIEEDDFEMSDRRYSQLSPKDVDRL
jgi:hypothetical protein